MMKKTLSILLCVMLTVKCAAACADGGYNAIRKQLSSADWLGEPSLVNDTEAASLVLAVDFSDNTVMLLGITKKGKSEGCLWNGIAPAMQTLVLKTFLTDFSSYQNEPGGFTVAYRYDGNASYAYITDASSAAAIAGQLN